MSPPGQGPPPGPLTTAEALRARFLDEIERLTPEQWLAIGVRLDAEGSALAANRPRVSRLIDSYLKAKLASDRGFQRHTIAFNNWAHARLVAVLGRLPASVGAAGRPFPLRATATSAARIAESLLRLFEDDLAAEGGPALAAPALRPFAGFVTLPGWPELSSASRRPRRAKAGATESRRPTTEPPEAFHLCFPAAYFAYDEPPPEGLALAPLALGLRDTHHETWNLPAHTSTTCRFGGMAEGQCGLCGGPLHHLVSLPQLRLPAVSGDGIGPLSVATCLSCLGWAEPVLFFEHASGGTASATAVPDAPRGPGLPGVAIRPATVRLCPTPPRFRRQPWEDSDGQNLNRVGGRASWIQDPEVPRCPRCGRRTRFLLQLDSELPTVDGSRWRWGSGGLLYVFWCAACRVDAQLWQCT